uniref:Ankyrin repeat domain-containing protein SOWAHB-like n=1 Tax=Scleropages formosus TaxID=113540 RepID=A0A8C9SJ00_SCLFO
MGDDVSEESLLEYLFSAGGKAKNSDMLKTYRHFGEKYVVLKKKYKQLMQEREADQRTDKSYSPSRHTGSALAQELQTPVPALVIGGVPKGQYEVSWCRGPSIIITEAPELHPLSGAAALGSLCFCVGGAILLTMFHTSQLEPLEKEWMHSAACGQLDHLSHLLQQDPSLASKKVLITTALHWAAKHGRDDMVALMVKSGVDVNMKAGYTPLHIAALHGHHRIIDLLVGTYGAKKNVRDYSGHLAHQYLNTRDPAGEDGEAGEFTQLLLLHERKARRLVTLFQHKKKWGSAEDLATISEERPTGNQLSLPPFRPRKFSR